MDWVILYVSMHVNQVMQITRFEFATQAECTLKADELNKQAVAAFASSKFPRDAHAPIYVCAKSVDAPTTLEPNSTPPRRLGPRLPT